VIQELVERHAADLLVMGSVSRGGIAGLLLGNTAERLLDRVHCSLLTIKPRDFISPI
jgi:nucleotide-binding universal stress UspA family protein